MNKELHDAFESSLKLIENGLEIERAIALYPDLADELHEPLTTAAMLIDSNASFPSRGSIRSSREKVIAAMKKQARRTLRYSFAPLRLRSAWALGVVVFVIVGSGILTASASALPGGALYPLKRAVERLRYELTLTDQSQADLEAQLRRERITEAQALIEGGLQSSVSLQGQIDRITGSQLIVDGLLVQVAPDWEGLSSTEPGDWVAIEGQIEDGRVLAISVQYFPALWTGEIERMDGSAWIIGDMAFLVDSATSGAETVTIGDLVTVEISPDLQGNWRAASLIPDEGETLIEMLAVLAGEENERVAEWTGQIVSIHSTWVQIGKVTVRIGSWTELESDLQPGDWVSVEARWDGDWWALEIEAVDELDFDHTLDRERFDYDEENDHDLEDDEEDEDEPDEEEDEEEEEGEEDD
jgi:hypothetical protein